MNRKDKARARFPFEQTLARLGRLKMENGAYYQDLLEALVVGYPEHWSDLAQVLKSGVGRAIVENDGIRMLWADIVGDRTLPEDQWQAGAQALLDSLGWKQGAAQLGDELIRGSRTADNAVRSIPLIQAICRKEGKRTEDNFWRKCGACVLGWIMGGQALDALDMLMTTTTPQQGLGTSGTMTWAQTWVLTRVDVGRGERDDEILQRLVAWGVDLERTNAGCSLLTLAARGHDPVAARESLDLLLFAGAHPNTLNYTGLRPETRSWVEQHPRWRRDTLSAMEGAAQKIGMTPGKRQM